MALHCHSTNRRFGGRLGPVAKIKKFMNVFLLNFVSSLLSTLLICLIGAFLVSGRSPLWFPALQNAQVVNNVVLLPEPLGPKVSGVDRFKSAYETELGGLGLTFKYPVGSFFYHEGDGEVHCSSNRFSKPYPEADSLWWKQEP